MDKITILKTNTVYKNGEVEYDTVVITEEEIEKEAWGTFKESFFDEDYEKGFLACWEYIKSRINQ